MASVIRNGVKILIVLAIAGVYYILFKQFSISDDKIILTGNFLFTINTIFFPVLVSLLQGFSFPGGVKISVVKRIKFDIKVILKRAIAIFAFTSVTSLPLVLFSDSIISLAVDIKYFIWSLILGFLSFAVFYYTVRFYRLYLLKEDLEIALLDE